MTKYRALVENRIYTDTNIQTSTFVTQDAITGNWHISARYKDDQGVNYIKFSSGRTREDAIDSMISKILCNI